MNRWFLIFCFLVLELPCSLQGQQYRFESYGQAEGLSELGSSNIAFDKKGFLWVATPNGLFHLLGSHFESYGREQGLTDRNVLEVYVDPEDRVWAVTSEKLFLLRDNRFSPVDSSIDYLNLRHNIIALAPDRVLVRNRNELRELRLDAYGRFISSAPFFSAAQRTARPQLDTIISLALAKDGKLWLGCGTGICSIADGVLKTWGPQQGVGSSQWLNLYIDHRGSVWAASKTKLLELPKESAAFKDRSPPKVSEGYSFRWFPIAEDRLGRILVNSDVGLARWNGFSWQSIGPKNGLTKSRITSLAIDNQGDPWIGTVASGLFHWAGYEHWEAWTDSDGLPSSVVFSLNTERRDQVLIGTRDGPAVLDTDKQRIKSLVGNKTWPYGQVGGIARTARGQIVLTTFPGWILLINPESFVVKPIAKHPEYFFLYKLFASADRRLWILSDTGVTVLNDSGSSFTVGTVVGPERFLGINYKAAAMAAVKGFEGDVWLLGWQGLLRYHAGVWMKPRLYGIEERKVRLRELSSAPDGSLWVAGQDEAQRLAIWHLTPNGESLQAERIVLPTYLDDVPPISMLVDRRGWLWLGTNTGLAGWNGSAWRFFNQQSGLIWNDTTHGVLCEGLDGSIWVGTSGGAAHLLHPETAFSSVVLSTTITAIQRNEQSYAPEKTLSLPWDPGSLRFRFASPNSWNRSSLSFSYRILGLNSSWSSTQSTEASFLSLPPGKFRFQVFAKNEGLGATSALAESSFEILPPWWRTLWFYCVCTVAAILLVWLLIWFRTRALISNRQQLQRVIEEMSVETRRLAKREQDAALAEQRNVLAHELHDSLAGAFTGIFMQLQAASDLAESAADKSKECVTRAETLAREGLRSVREFVQSLTTQAAERPPTLDLMQKMITSATEGTATAGSFVVEGLERPLKLSHSHAVVLIMQETLGNAQRYAEAKNIAVRLRFEEDLLALEINDDGRGFRVDELSSVGFGITGMKARTNRLGGQCCIESSIGSGTKISITLPHPYETK